MIGAGSASLAGCSLSPQLFLLNNSGRAVDVLAASNDGDQRTSEMDGWFFSRRHIAVGRGREIIWSQDGQDIWVLLRSAHRQFWHRVPILKLTSSNAYCVVQLQPDLSVWLLADNVWRTEERRLTVRADLPDQTPPYPLQPIEAQTRRG